MFVSKVNFCQFNTEIVWMLEIIVNKTKKAHAYVQREGFVFTGEKCLIGQRVTT